MLTLLRCLPLPELMKQEAPAFLIAFLLAEFFYKFHSFTLECAAFLATWYALGLVSRKLRRNVPEHAPGASSAGSTS